MAAANDIERVAQSMPNVPRWIIEQRINDGQIDMDNYED